FRRLLRHAQSYRASRPNSVGDRKCGRPPGELPHHSRGRLRRRGVAPAGTRAGQSLSSYVQLHKVDPSRLDDVTNLGLRLLQPGLPAFYVCEMNLLHAPLLSDALEDHVVYGLEQSAAIPRRERKSRQHGGYLLDDLAEAHVN